MGRPAEGETPRDGRQDAGATRLACCGECKKENRAGWPGFLCVELDAVTSQRGATGAEAALLVGLGPVRSPESASSCQVPDRRTEVEDPKEQGNRQGAMCK